MINYAAFVISIFTLSLSSIWYLISEGQLFWDNELK